MPGGELIGPYLDQLSRAILEAGRGGARGNRARDADVGHRTVRPRPEPGPARSGERRRPDRLRLQPRRGGGRHARRGARDGGRRRSRPRDDRQLRLPPDDARVGEHAHLARLHRRHARARRAAHRRRAVPVPPRCVRRARPGPPVRRRPGGGRPARPPARVQRARGARGHAARRPGAALRRRRRVGRAARRLAARPVRALARARRRGRRRAAAAEADADGGGARGAAGGHGRPGDRGAALPQDPDPAQPERWRPRDLPRLGLARRRQPRRRAGQRGVLVLPGGPQAGVPGHDGRGHEHERGRDGLPVPARARRPRRLPGVADAVREGGAAHPDRALHRGGRAALRREPA